MIQFTAALAFFLAFHVILPSRRVRAAIIGRIGEQPYLGLYSLASIAQLWWVISAFGAARGAPGDLVFWEVHPTTRYVQIGLQLVAFTFAVAGISTPSPTNVQAPGSPNFTAESNARGMTRITRHPFLWGVVIWACGHMLVNGDAVSLTMFATMLVLSIWGTFSIDARRRRSMGEAWAAFEAETSNVPFAAILQGRQSLKLGEIGLWRVALAAAVWAGVLFLHPYFTGMRALP